MQPSKEQPLGSCPTAGILIVDDAAEWRLRVREILETRPELQIVGEAGDGLQGIQRAVELNPDLVLIDIGMPILNGIEAAKQILRTAPRSKIVFLTQERDCDIRGAALDVGAVGYVLKANAATELIPSIVAVLRNGHRAS